MKAGLLYQQWRAGERNPGKHHKKILLEDGVFMLPPVFIIFLLMLIINIKKPQNAIAMHTVELPEISPFSSEAVLTEVTYGSQGPPGSGEDIVPVEEGKVCEKEVCEKEVCEKEVYIGEMKIAAYCGCDSCVGKSNTFRTYSGNFPKPGRTVAANLEFFRIGERLKINGHIYTVEDKVSSSAKEQLCIFFNDHEEAIRFGRQTCSVFKIEVPPEQDPSYLGTFIVTGYCSCDECCGEKEKKLTKTETVPKSGHTIAVDPQVLPFGTKVVIDGKIYTAEDTGSVIKGQMIDIYFDTHEEAVIFGRQEKKVYLACPPVTVQQIEK